MILETAAIASAAKPLIEKMVVELITPKITQFAGWCKGKYKENMIPTAEHFQEYLERSYAKYSIVNTLVFHNSQRLLKEIYVAQTIVKEHQSEGDNETAKIDKLPVSLIEKYKKILITDTAGMGKSTIMKKMFIDLIDNGLNLVGIPVYIELNKLNKENTILDEIQEALSSLSKQFDNDLLLKFIQTGGFIFFLDGFDEISISDKSEVTNDIQKFISKAGTNNYYILTSRSESSLSSFGDFQSFTIQPLAKEESFELLKKYDTGENKELSEKLIDLLKSGQYNSINEYLENPLLVSLLFTAYDYKRSIPFEKHRFYAEVFEAYFEKHDNTKPIRNRDKLSGLNYDGFDRVLRRIGFLCLAKIGVKFNRDTIINAIINAREFCENLKFSESDFLEDLLSAVPLFCHDGNDYKWVHKSLLEYFAARYIAVDAKENQNTILSKIYNSKQIERYLNMLDLYYDIDYNGFNKNIRYPFCKDFVNHYDSICYDNKRITKQLVDERISKLFLCRPIVIRLSKKSFDDFVKVLGNRKEEDYIYKVFGINNKANSFGYSHSGFSLTMPNNILEVYNTSSLTDISLLLFNHSEDLFFENMPAELPKIAKLVDNYLECDKVYEIEINTGDSCNECFSLFNKLIGNPSRYLKARKNLSIDYFACKKVVDEYETKIATEDFDSLDDL